MRQRRDGVWVVGSVGRVQVDGRGRGGRREAASATIRTRQIDFGVGLEACTARAVRRQSVGTLAVRVQLGPFDRLICVRSVSTQNSAAGAEDVLSSKSSVNRFRVNFQMTNATMPINATPPATDRPMMVDVLTPLLVLSSLPVSAPAVLVAEAELDGSERVTVTRMKDVEPSASVVAELERNVCAGAEDVCEGGVVMVVLDVLDAEVAEADVGVGVGVGVWVFEGGDDDDDDCESGVEAAEAVDDDVVDELAVEELVAEVLAAVSEVAESDGKSIMALGATWLTSGPSRRS